MQRSQLKGNLEMARKTSKPVKVHPSLMGGSPQHGDPHPGDDPDFDLDEELEIDEDENEDDDDGNPSPQPQPDDLEVVRENARLKAELEVLRRNANPPPRAGGEEEEEIDWDDLLFSNPKEALRLHGEQIRKQVTSELRGEYQRDQGTEKFWSDFYGANKDLKDDKELVDFMLSKNMAELADLPVEKAMSRLADLTRAQIMGYQKRAGPGKRNRAVAEGSSIPSSAPAPKRQDRPTTLSDILKARKVARRKGATAA